MQTGILIYIISYIAVFILSWVGHTNHSQRLVDDAGRITSKPGNLTGISLISILWMGAVPALFLKHPVVRFLTGTEIPAGWLLILFLVLFILTVITAIKLSENFIQSKYSITEKGLSISPNFIYRYLFIRGLFLTAYELWFRGFLLFECINWVGVPLAILINVFFYTLLHIFNSKKEIWACIPFGTLLCVLSIVFNAVWPAILLHIAFSMIYEVNIYRHYTRSLKLTRA